MSEVTSLKNYMSDHKLLVDEAGARLNTDIRFASVSYLFNHDLHPHGLHFLVVARKDYLSQCKKHDLDWKIITPDDYRQARANNGVDSLFATDGRGIIFFDDMDIAIRNRETTIETEDQGIFLTALDGIRSKKGVVFVFTTNCSIKLIDKAFCRPGRIDVVLQFELPNAELRRRVIDTWNEKVRASLDVDRTIQATKGFSFAELDEVKNLYIMNWVEKGVWNWDESLERFKKNRSGFQETVERRPGFSMNLASEGEKVNGELLGLD